jgi:hypothetical protein
VEFFAQKRLPQRNTAVPAIAVYQGIRASYQTNYFLRPQVFSFAIDRNQQRFHFY